MGGPTTDVSVVTSGHDIADARLHRQVAALTAHGLSVEVLALGHGVDAPREAVRVRTWPRRSHLGRAALAVEMVGRASGKVLLTLDPDSALAAAGVTAARRRHLVVDAHEDYSALLRDRPWALRAYGFVGHAAAAMVHAYLEVASRASLTVVADEQVPPLRARRRLVLPNLPYPRMLPAPADPDLAPRALYIGDVRTSRGLFAMLEALRAAPRWTCDVVGPVAVHDQVELERRLEADPGLAARVRFHGRRTPERAWALAPGAWCGLLLLTDTPAFRGAVPTKLGEYLASGLPVVSTDLPRQGAILRASGAGVLVPVGDDAAVGAEVGLVLESWADDPAALRALRARARAAAGDADLARAHYARFAEAVGALL